MRPCRSKQAYATALRSEGQREVAVVGAHGGAGCSTIAALLQPAWDLGSIGHLYGVGRRPVDAKGRPLVLVCRNTVTAARAATTAVTVLRSYEQSVACLVVVSDGEREPRDASARFTLIQARVGGIVRFPYVRDFRRADDPVVVDLNHTVLRALIDVHEALRWAEGGVRA